MGDKGLGEEHNSTWYFPTSWIKSGAALEFCEIVRTEPRAYQSSVHIEWELDAGGGGYQLFS